jgi:hypothetical protein
MKSSFCESEVAFFSKIKSYYATKLSATSSDLLEFRTIEYDAGFTLLGLLAFISSCDNFLFFSFFNALNVIKIEVTQELKIRRNQEKILKISS